MSAAPVTSGMYASSPAMGQYSSLEPNYLGEEGKLVQLELRRMKKGVPMDDWLTLAINVFKMIRRVQR